jgi:hypothetical protein
MYDKTTDTLSIYPQLQSFFNENIIHRGATVGINDNFLMSFNIGYLFIADKDCELELKSASMHESDFINKTNIISGAFNINKWYRPIEIAFEIKNPNDEIKIKRGDALAYIKFTPKDGNKVKVEQKNFPAETIEAVTACLYAKDASNKFPLKTLYKFSERIRNKLWFNKKKCPFNWRNK